jgi:multiple sugar transport system permease protein
MRKSSLDKRSPLLMISPMILVIMAFLLFLIYVLGLSVTDSTLAKPFKDFVGFANYAKAFGDANFGRSVWLMLVFAFGVTIIETLLGFIFAMALYSEVKAGKFLRTLALLPLFTPPVAVGMIWKLVYDPGSGFLNHYLLQWGILKEPLGFLGSNFWAMPSIMAADIWQWTPFCFLLCLAAFQSLPYDPYEAAAVDGASDWQVFRRLTLPLVLPSVIVTFLFRLLIALKVFDLIFMLTYGGPGISTQVASFYIYKIAFTTFKTGYGSAMTVLVFLLISVIATVLTLGRQAYMNRGK